jgi:hypothetical protein
VKPRKGRAAKLPLVLYDETGRDKRYFDTASGKIDKATLTKEWKEYTIDLGDKDLTRIKTGFGFSLAGQGGPVTSYLDDIRFE